MSSATCRSCGAPWSIFVDLGMSPLCESFLRADQLNSMEPFYPLHAYVCDQCGGVQLHEYVSGEAIFSDYAYFSSYSDSWVKHAQRYMDAMISRFHLGRTSLVFEVASNDGYLLQHAVAAKIPCLGIEPAANIAKVAVERGIPTVVHFLGRDTAKAIVAEHGRADLVAANNVFAHVPDLNDFTAGLATLLAPTGVLTIEVPHLVKLVSENQFDTIYHEHFCYHSLVAAERVFERHGLVIFDVEELSTHGGSLRYFVRHANDTSKPIEGRVAELRNRERALGVETLAYYRDFTAKVEETKRSLLTFLIEARRAGARVVGVRRPRQGEHPPQLLRHPDRPARIHRGPEPAQAGDVPAGHPHSYPPSGQDPAGQAGLRALPPLEPQGRTGVAARLRSGVGGQVRRPDSGDGGAALG